MDKQQLRMTKERKQELRKVIEGSESRHFDRIEVVLNLSELSELLEAAERAEAVTKLAEQITHSENALRVAAEAQRDRLAEVLRLNPRNYLPDVFNQGSDVYGRGLESSHP